jgi:exopolysaccharide biosynthesis polyprenyl glycosylphosphotransferase
MFARRSHLVGLQCLAHDLGLTLLAFPVAYLLRSRVAPRVWHGLGPVYPFQMYWPLLLAILVLWPVLGYTLRTYQQVDPRGKLQLARDAAALVIVGGIFAFATLYLIHAEYVSRSFVLIFAGVDAVFLIIGRWCFFSAGAWFRDRLERYRYFLIVGTGAAARELGSFIDQGAGLGQRLVGFVHTNGEPPPADLDSYRVFPVERVPELIETEPVDEIIFAVNRQELGSLEPLMLRCQEEGIHTRVHLDFLPLTVSRVYLENLRDVPLLTFASTPDNELLLFLKRAFDVVLSIVALALLSPVLLALALLVRLTSPGPILYRQTRCGLGGRRFTLLKFRSMVDGADRMRKELEHRNEAHGPVFKITNDPRCTPLGRWLRKFSLDELPQLWNILRGDMSFVGPRPPLAEEVAQYETWQRRRLRMRPGLTCLWAMEGRSQIRFERWMQLDLAYIDNWSLWLDLKIFVKTIPHVLRGRGAC